MVGRNIGERPDNCSKWCTNTSQPDLHTLKKIAEVLEVDIKELIVREYNSYIYSQEYQARTLK